MKRAVVLLLLLGAAAAVGSTVTAPAGVAIAALAASLAGWWSLRRVKAHRRRDAVQRLRGMTPARFEHEVGAWFSRAGFVVEHRGRSGDHGLDLVAFRGGDVVAVQCKRYAERQPVTPAQIRELYGAAAAIGATRALLVTTGRFSAAGASWAQSLTGAPRLTLVGPERLDRRPGAINEWLSS